jgi:glutamate-1-semialdehyde aminotransferase
MTGAAHSQRLFQAACEIIPGGVNSPVRAWQAVGLPPRLILRGEGPGSMTWTATPTWILWPPGGR